MDETGNSSSAGADITAPSAARVLDYLLGDANNFPADRRLAEELQRALPDITMLVQLGRTFMRRAVTHLVAAGVRQFLDLSVGTTAMGNVHEVAQGIDPTCRVVYAHIDPISVAHTGRLIAGVERTAVLQADPRDPAKVLARAGDLLDLTAPVGLLMVAILEVLPDSTNLVKMVAGYRDRVVPGSHLVICHLTGDRRPAEMATLVEVMSASPDLIYPRTREEVVRLFTGFELVPPGVADAGWRAERPLDPAEKLTATQLHVGVGRKPRAGTA
ncbi:SAM-dependent methyltransferase [Actinophytocola sp.]|uniref:SAM-dependent methyltransferase n=1 Tax=Actinophytocola sp. TaxID=1872138 RepID=UPI002ED16EDA